ncbi:hypothetical protein BDW02DRAFT_539807 [Decorospora gaudefroyi]|uniref:Polyketide cyclase/dehydrase n=1 Tax=Decorospora gaudefroyi TaxID=184978 RepID=A0A6A5KQJ5_9PLEO|nr:hypothetical protein BDW02DRAFT_539807 [Decorospora gaudefroyi]
MATQSAINWPSHFLPGTTDNFVSNERIAKDVTSTQIWALLANISKWPSHYKNCDQITPPGSTTFLHKSDVFKFSTFGFPPLTCTVEESSPPESNGAAGRLAWSSKTPEGLEIYHAWVVEDLEGQRVRILTQESQIGSVFKEMGAGKPNKMLLGHQDWVDGLIAAARGDKVGETNLEAIGFPVRK